MQNEQNIALPGFCVEIFPVIESTNTYLREKAKQENIGKTIVLAHEQTGGRGRMGRSFHSPKDAGLYMSMLLPLGSVSESDGLTLRIGVALYHAIKGRFPNLAPTLKWVNDIYIRDKKLAGILVEGTTRPDGTFCAVVGVGMNFLATAFPKQLESIATSIESETGEKATPFSFVEELVREIEKALKTPLCEVTEVYRTHAYLKGKRLLILPHGRESYGGEYVGIDENGALVIRKENGELVTLFSGDVSVKPDI